jgi:hypothetical protein
MLTEFIFGSDSDLIMRALLQLVSQDQPSWLLLPLQSMLSRLIVEHGQVPGPLPWSACLPFKYLWVSYVRSSRETAVPIN